MKNKETGKITWFSIGRNEKKKKKYVDYIINMSTKSNCNSVTRDLRKTLSTQTLLHSLLSLLLVSLTPMFSNLSQFYFILPLYFSSQPPFLYT